MILDKFLTYDQKVAISILCGSLWIYFRTSDCYLLIPRLHLFPVVFVGLWIYLNYYEPLFLPIGLAILLLYAYFVIENETKYKNK
jgi:hypothetical protein